MRNRNGNLAVRLKPVVSAATVLTIRDLRQRARHLKAQLEALEAEADPLEKTVIEALEAGALVEPGAPLVSVKTDLRRNVKWRQEFETRLGTELAEKVVADTPPTVSKKLIING